MDEMIELWKERISPCFLEYPFSSTHELYDENGRLHSETEPALVTDTSATWYDHGLKHGLHLTKDGQIDYYFRGIKIPSHINPKFLNRKTVYGIMEGLVV
jgi:hypothetical protein